MDGDVIYDHGGARADASTSASTTNDNVGITVVVGSVEAVLRPWHRTTPAQ
jgi:hypothetical protein